MNGPITLTVKANVRWWVKPLLKGMERALNVLVWVITNYGVKIRIPKK